MSANQEHLVLKPVVVESTTYKELTDGQALEFGRSALL